MAVVECVCVCMCVWVCVCVCVHANASVCMHAQCVCVCAVISKETFDQATAKYTAGAISHSQVTTPAS